jgi:hypothetical protein
MESDVEKKKNEVGRVVDIGKNIVEEDKSENEKIKDIENKVNVKEYRWNGLDEIMKESKERIYLMKEKK